MKTKYFKQFAITEKQVSVEELRTIAQKQARMHELVRFSPIQHLSDGHFFLMDEISNMAIPYTDILWAEGIDSAHSFLHMKDGQTFTAPFSADGLFKFLLGANNLELIQISYRVFVSLDSIEKISRKELYIKGCVASFKIGKAYYNRVCYRLYNHLTKDIKKWRVEDYVRWKNRM